MIKYCTNKEVEPPHFGMTVSITRFHLPASAALLSLPSWTSILALLPLHSSADVSAFPPEDDKEDI